MSDKLHYYHRQLDALSNAQAHFDNTDNFIDSEIFASLNAAEQLQTHETMQSLTLYIKKLKALVSGLESDLGLPPHSDNQVMEHLRIK